MTVASERCAPRKVGFAAAVGQLVARARAKEAARTKSVPEPELYDSARAEFLAWLAELGVESRAAELSLDSHEKIVKLNFLRELADKQRAIWAPQVCPWVGALEDEALLIAREL